MMVYIGSRMKNYWKNLISLNTPNGGSLAYPVILHPTPAGVLFLGGYNVKAKTKRKRATVCNDGDCHENTHNEKRKTDQAV